MIFCNIFPLGSISGQLAGHIVESQKFTKSPKNRFWPKIQMLVEWPILAGMMIYGRKWVLKVFQNRFAPKIIVLTLIDHILNNFEKIDFLDFSFVGFGHFRSGRIFYGSEIGQILAGTCLSNSCLFPKKMPTIRSGYFRNAIRICTLVPISQNGHITHLSKLLN